MTAQARAELADAISTVDGLTCQPYLVGMSTAPGSAHVRLDRIEFPNRLGGIAHWEVAVVLPKGYGAAEEYVEDRLTSILAALEGIAVVTAVQIERLDISGTGALPIAVITAHREV